MTWPAPLNPGDPGVRDDTGTDWPHTPVIRRSGTQPDIRERGMARRRGADVHSAKLTDAIVRSARSAHAAGISYADLARTYGVTPTAVRRAIIGETWRHV